MTFSLDRLRRKKHFASPEEMPMEIDVQLPPEGIPILARHTPPPLPGPPAKRLPSGRGFGRRETRIRAENSIMCVLLAIFPAYTTAAYLKAWAWRLAAEVQERSTERNWNVEVDLFAYEEDHPQVGVSITCRNGPTLPEDMDAAKALLSSVLRGSAA